MSLQLARFQRVKPDGTLGEALRVQFNPAEYTLSKSVQIAELPVFGLDSPILQPARRQSETLTLDLFFDTTDQGTGDSSTSVTAETDRFYELIKIESSTHASPVCLFSWGGEQFPGGRSYSLKNQQRHGFKCIIESVRQRYTLFSPTGTPLRAILTVTLREYKTLAEQIDELNLQSSDHTKIHLVQQGETLSHIAARAYGDPNRWRQIAEHNQIENPLDLRPGMILDIPPLR